MLKLKQIKLCGFRGVLGELSLELNNSSTLIYGDNGSGKSSISDAIEWFLFDTVRHLPSAQESGSKQGEALRHVKLELDTPASVHISFTSSILDSSKTISIAKTTFDTSHSNTLATFKQYLIDSKRERILLRHSDLLDFVCGTKTEKKDALFAIIGYAEIPKYFTILRRALKSQQKKHDDRNIDTLISIQKQKIVDELKAVIATEKQYVEAIKTVLKDNPAAANINSIADIETILPSLSKPVDLKVFDMKSLLTGVYEVLTLLEISLQHIDTEYQAYRSAANDLSEHAEGTNKLLLSDLLDRGLKLIQSNYTEDYCPLCESEVDIELLIHLLKKRTSEFRDIKKRKTELDDSRITLQNRKTEVQTLLSRLSTNPDLYSIEYERILAVKLFYSRILEQILASLGVESTINHVIPEIIIDTIKCTDLQRDIATRIENINLVLKNDISGVIYSQVKITLDAMKEMKTLERERSFFREKNKTLRLITDAYKEMQKNLLKSFLDKFSNEISDYYEFMNPNQKVGKIRLATVQNGNEELEGLNIEYDFLNLQSVSPPQKFLSESNLNCLGLSFFLTSVKAFNTKNSFIVLDDVISSFDSAHRIRFADLLVERFNNMQLIILTHEKYWFDYFAAKVKGKGWVIKTVKWTKEKGSFLSPLPDDLKARIQKKLSDYDEENLAKDIREYIELRGKDIACNLEVKMAFRYNDSNEERMSYELLTAIQGECNKQRVSASTDVSALGRLISTLQLGNLDTHDNRNKPKFDDSVAFWKDVEEFEKLFYCKLCFTPISIIYYDSVEKKIRCKCGHLNYEWKK